MSMRLFSLCLFSLFSAGTLLAQTPIYLQPSLDTAPLASVPNERLEALKPTPSMDASQAAEGWHWVQLPGTFSGFISTKSFNKALEVLPDSIVSLRASPNSPILAILQPEDTYEITRGDEDYARITFEKAVVVYFLRPGPTAARPVAARESNPGIEGLNAPVAEEAPAPVPLRPLVTPGATPVESGEPKTLDVFTPDTPSRMGELPKTSFQPPRDIFQNYTGILKLEKHRLFGRKPVEPAGLYSLDGKQRIAYVNLDQAFLQGPLNEYHKQIVTIQGNIVESNFRERRTIQARFIQLIHANIAPLILD